MIQHELNNSYKEITNYILGSKKEAYMKRWLSIANEQMDWLINNKPEIAEEFIDKLNSVRWDNYVTRKEAETLVDSMSPKARWSREQWANHMTDYGLPLDEEGHYNSCSMWVVMNMVWSDDMETISDLLGKPISSMTEEEIMVITHKFALNKLMDPDKHFNIRAYFNLP